MGGQSPGLPASILFAFCNQLTLTLIPTVTNLVTNARTPIVGTTRFSYRHQLKALKAAGFRAIAPFMRGYGTKTPPAHFSQYNVYNLAADMLAILTHVGVRRAALVGHDHGAATGWQLSLLHPDVFVCYFAMSVPYSGRTLTPPLSHMRSIFGDERNPACKPRFFYMVCRCPLGLIL